MTKPLHIIYIPGLGDVQEPQGQLRAISGWPKYGVEAEMFRMRWADKEPWEPKFKRLLTRVDKLVAEGKDVGLVGVSAGASAAINVFAARKDVIVGCVLIAGKVNRPNFIGTQTRRENPAFFQSATACEQSLKTLTPADRQRILSRYGVIDMRVSRTDSHIPGARNRTIPSLGHFLTIASQITLGARGLVNFLQHQATISYN